MAKVRCSLRVLISTCLVASTWVSIDHVFAATKHTKEPATAVAVPKPAKQHSVQKQNSPLQQANKSPLLTARKRQPEAIQKQAKPVLTARQSKRPKGYRRVHVHKPSALNAVVKPRTDLMHHGMMESSQRYNPRRNHLGAGVPDPYNPELTHDHFQELDRNQDGAIDPVERTIGRPEMEWDLSTHQRQ